MAGTAGLAVIGLLVWRTNQYSDFMFRGGLLLLSAATAAVVAAVVTPGSLLGRALGIRPLRWLGVRSYGIYLWHYPLIVLTATAGGAGGPVSPGRAVALIAATVAVAALSWRLIEEPVRRGGRPRLAVRATTGVTSKVGEPVRISVANATGGAGMAGKAGGPGEPGRPGGAGAGGGRSWRPGRVGRVGLPRTPRAAAGLCLLTAALLAAGVTAAIRLTPAGAHAAAGPRPGASAAATTAKNRLSNASSRPSTVPATARGAGTDAVASGTAGPGSAPSVGGGAVTVAAAGPMAAVPALPTPPPRTSCASVVHIGDSTSEGLTSRITCRTRPTGSPRATRTSASGRPS